MHGTREIIREAVALPVQERALVVDSLLRSLNRTEASIDRAWIAEARRRRSAVRSGLVKPVPGEKVLAKLRSRCRPRGWDFILTRWRKSRRPLNTTTDAKWALARILHWNCTLQLRTSCRARLPGRWLKTTCAGAC